LRFFNPLREQLGVEIIFNGFKKSDSYLILKPGQDVILDRFIDDKHKMLFETYTIDSNNSDSVEAIQNNGDIIFNFYKGRYYNPYNQTIFGSTYGSFSTSGHSGKSGTSGSPGVSGTPTNVRRKGLQTEQIKSKWSPIDSTKHTDSINYFSSTTTFSGDFNSTSFTDFNVTNKNSRTYNPLETGRIEKGDISEQTLKSVDIKFESFPFYSMSYKMLPLSTKSKEISEIRQYCDSCGYRVRKQSWSFCPKCGNKFC